jgi:hypothetical protein
LLLIGLIKSPRPASAVQEAIRTLLRQAPEKNLNINQAAISEEEEEQQYSIIFS